MIIDSHSHYTHSRFDGEFPYLCNVNSVYSVNRADREALFNEMKINGIEGCIEVAITLDGIEKIASLSSHVIVFTPFGDSVATNSINNKIGEGVCPLLFSLFRICADKKELFRFRFYRGCRNRNEVGKCLRCRFVCITQSVNISVSR